MAYRFNPIMSTYVDPNSVKVSEILNERFTQNFAVNDALNTALRDMQYAPFENDVALAKEVQKTTDTKLSEFATRGDYENMTFPLHSLAKETGNKLKPLAENYQRYQGTLTDLSERLKKGDVNAEQYELYKGYMTRGYKGIELDERGRLKEGTGFSAPTLYNDPKIMDRVTKRLEILHQQKTGSTTSGVQRDPSTGDLLVIEQGGTMSRIDPKDVQDVVDAVMQESDVKMYLDQMGTMKAYRYSDAAGGPDQLIQAQVNNLQGQIGELNSALNSGKYSGNQKLQIKNSINSLQNELQSINNLSTPEDKLAYTKNSFIKEYERPVREFASKKGGIYEQTSVYKVDNISAKERERQTIEFDVKNPNMYATGEVNATQFGGKDTQEKLKNIDTKQKTITALEAELTSGYSTDVNGNQVALNERTIKENRDEIKRLKSDIQIATGQVKQAARNSISYSDLEKQDPTLIRALADYYGTKDSGELYVKLQQVFDNTGDQDYLNFEQYFNASEKVSTDKYDLSKHLAKFYGSGSNMSNFENERQNRDIPSFGQQQMGTFQSTKVLDEAGVSVVGAFNNKFQSKIDKGLLEVKTSTTFLMDKVPGLTTEESIAFTNKMNNLVLNKPVIANAVYTDASGNEVPIETLNGYKVVHYGSDAAGTNLIRFDLVSDSDGATTKTVYMDRGQLTNQGIEQVYSSNSYKLASRMIQAGNVGTYSLDLNLVNPNSGENAGTFKLKFNDIRGNGKPLVTIADANGNNIPKEWFEQYGLPPVVGAISPNSQLFTDFINLNIVQIN